MIHRSVHVALALAVLTVCTQTVLTAGDDRKQAEPSPTRSGLHLFNVGTGALNWDNDELARMRNLHAKDFNNMEEFMKAPNLAEYLGLSQVESIHMSVPLNVVLIGFNGDGNAGVNITLDELEEWFEHIDHVLPHTRIDHSELTCQEDGQCAGLVSGRFHPTPMRSYVHLNFTANVVLVKRRAVVDAFERAIAAFSRPVDPAIETGMQQVDAFKMEGLVDHFLASLSLGPAYSLLLLNPTWHAEEPVYGYRLGVSSEELQLLRGQGDRLRGVMAATMSAEPHLPAPPEAGRRGGWAHGNAPAGKFATRDATWDSERWVDAVSAYLREEEAARRALLAAAGRERGAGAHAAAARLLGRPGSELGALLRQDLLGPWEKAADALYSQFHAAHPAEDCLVNAWVGSTGRWALLDLTAGGKDWGPALGGEGVVHHGSLPHVAEMWEGVRRLKEDARRSGGGAATVAAERAISDALEQTRASRLPSIANRHHHAYILKRQALRRAAAAPGAPPMDAAAQAAAEEDERAWRRGQQVVLLQAELDLLEEWAMHYCNGQAWPPLACGTWRDEAAALRSSLGKLHGAASADAVYEVFREHKWDIFGGERDLAELKPELYDEEEIAQDMLLGELAALLSRAIRHVIAPPTAAWAPRETHGSHGAAAPHGAVAAPQQAPAARHTTAAPFAHHVHFHIHLISDVSRQRHGNSDAPVLDVAAYQAALEGLRLPQQTFKYSVSRLTLHDEPALAAGVAAAARTTLHEIPSGEDFFDAESERVYLDSRELAATLRAHFAPTPRQAAAEARASRQRAVALTTPSRSVPVYVLLLSRDAAVLLDEHYNARSLPDMVLVVANAARRDEHPTGMMCGGRLAARPVSPLKEALAATLRHLGGVLPPHLGYSPRQHAITHDWLWSVGGHPLSFTSTGTRFTPMQSDALARAHLLDALDTSVAAVNEAVRGLAAQVPSEALWAHVQSHPTGLRDLLRKWADLVASWRAAVGAASSLDYAGALEGARSLEAEVDAFVMLSATSANLAGPARCAASLVDTVGPWLPAAWLGGGAMALLALVYGAWPKLMGEGRKAKAY